MPFVNGGYNMKKILISIFLAASMILTNISVIAEESANTEYKKAVDMLSMMNIISVMENNDDFSSQAYVTREEFCIYLSRAFKLETSNVTQVFTDVPVDSDLAQYIYTLYKKGVVSGYGGEFRPKDIITYNEAIKILVSILNYDYAASVGGYPSGYLRIASSLGITKKVSGVDRVTKGVAAQLIYNAMSAPFMELAGIQGNDISFKSNSDKSIFTELYNIHEGKGIVMANETSAFTTGANALEIGEVLIGNTVYKVGKTDVANLMGHYIEFYYQVIDEDDQEYEIVSIIEDNNEELVINARQIIEFKDNTYRYENEEGRVKKANLNSDFLIMYNFDYPVSNFNADMMIPDMGIVKLIQRGKDGSYSAVIIEEYENHIVSAVDEKSEVIYFKDKSNLVLRNGDCKLFDVEGNKIEISSVNEWNVVSVLTSSDGRKKSAYVSGNEIEGKITAKGTPSDPRVTINHEKYYADSKVLNNLKFGEDSVFYLDYCGNIAGAREVYSDELKYAYLTDTKIDSYCGENLDERVYVKLFELDGTENKYYLAEKVRINDILYKENPEAIINSALSLTVKILKYKLNSDGEISTLYVYDGTSNKYLRLLHSGSAYWNQKQRSFDGKVTLENGAPVFVVPEGYGVEDYSVVGLSSFAHDRKATAKVYTMGDNVYGEVVVRDSVSTSYERQIGIVKKITHVLDEYGDPGTKVAVMYNSSTQEFMLTKDEVLESVEEGDIVKISLDHNKNIQKFLHIYDRSRNALVQDTNPYEPQSGAGYRSENRCYLGYAYDVTDGLLRYCKELPTEESVPNTENALLSGFRIYVIEGNDISIGTENSIKGFTGVGNNCSKILVHTMWGDPEDIIIIK